jgi:hypothetical protein
MRHGSSLLNDDPMLRLQLADDGPEQPPLRASVRLLRAGSCCAHDLPSDSTVWDLSNLLIDGRPVKHDTVTAWINVLYMQLEGIHYMDAQGPPALDARRLYQVLAFADAVHSMRGVLRACLPKEELTITLKIKRNNGTGDVSCSWRICRPFAGQQPCCTRCTGQGCGRDRDSIL